MPHCETSLKTIKKIPTIALNGAETLLRSYLLLSQSIKSLHFTEPEGSLLCSQQPATSPYPDIDKSSLQPPPCYFFKTHFNIILPSMPVGILSSLYPSGFCT